jgi:hypothetical protein
MGMVLCASAAWGQSKPTEYEVKAAFLFNFARFVEWPEQTPQDTLHICIVGEDRFGAAFAAVTAQSKSQQPILVHVFDGDTDLPLCHILFVSGSEKRRLASILKRAGTRPVLTVSDLDGFAKAGGMIGFVLRKNKIRFQINNAAAARSKLTLSAKLLRLAEIVDDGGKH